MKQLLAILFIALIGIGIVIGCNKTDKPSYSLQTPEYFLSGDTIYPNHVCPDTLIVFDAKGLNKAWALYEQGIIDYSEYQLDSIYHTYTIKTEWSSFLPAMIKNQ